MILVYDKRWESGAGCCEICDGPDTEYIDIKGIFEHMDQARAMLGITSKRNVEPYSFIEIEPGVIPPYTVTLY